MTRSHRRTVPGRTDLAIRILAATFIAGLLQMPAWHARADSAPAQSGASDAKTLAKIDEIFADYALDSHIPGMVYGVVADGRLVHVHGLGVQDFESKRPVTADTLFRIASMTKAFTALTVLQLRDERKLQLDILAENYVPEMRSWKYPTQDSPRIRVRDLLNHTGGLVTDDPWGDRQTPLPEAEFSRFLRAGVPLAHAPGTAMEYSNLGFALLGRTITNASGKPYAETIARTLLQPLGMQSSGFSVDAAPADRRALGYRWEDDTWQPEPTMIHGAFGAMGGLQTSANDYAKWVAYLLSAWPPRDDADIGPVKRATVRELAHGSNFPRLRQRAGHSGADACRQAATYGMGMWVAVDCDLGLTLSHSGGYPGYGSHVLLLPDHGVGIFALANRTYAGPSGAVWDAAVALHDAGFFKDGSLPVSADLASAYLAVGTIYREGDVGAAGDRLAMNFLMDRDAQGWRRDLADLRKKVGECDTTATVKPTGTLSGDFTWRCSHGRVAGSVLLAPTQPSSIQSLKLAVKAP
ncbi:serine hydrolase domain-containing protein [Povalibacter sp.]|uniref:serine hydrolase domain-containing protein n=1 Tax=Povalibacter sp. TaxID=1962978 RepID=UPI002F40EBBD